MVDVLRAVRLPLEVPRVPIEELERLLHEDFWFDHRLGEGTWRVAREHREIPDISRYPGIVAIASMVPGVRHGLWVSVLSAGGRIRDHVDSARADAVRVHVPVVGAGSFEIEGTSYVMKVGEFWAVDTVGRLHGARNDGPIDRIHLLVDVRPSPWLRDHVPWL